MSGDGRAPSGGAAVVVIGLRVHYRAFKRETPEITWKVQAQAGFRNNPLITLPPALRGS